MRSIVFVQYFTVTELIKLKLLNKQLSQILTQETIEMSIQIGNLDGLEREIYWKSFAKVTKDEVYKKCPYAMIDLMKNSQDSTLFIIKSTLQASLEFWKDSDEAILKLLSHLFLDQQVYRICDTPQE